MKRRYFYTILPVFGIIFGLCYIYMATSDVIYTDYVRLTNSYLPDVWNPEKFFVADILTRVPVNYLGRIINTMFFGYSLTFDRVLGILSLGLSGLVLGSYCRRKSVSGLWFWLLMIVMFSLNKWEMMINGSGWVHFLAFACFYYHYTVLDRVWSGAERPTDRRKLIILPFIITVFIAGPYCAIYCVTVILANGFMMLLDYWKRKKADKRYAFYALAGLVPLLLYMWSNFYAIEDHAAPATVSLTTQLLDTPSYFVRFFVKSFSSMVIGGERASEIFKTNTPFFVLGTLVIIAYLLALWLNFRYKLYEKTIFPLILVVSGGLNHVLIVASRWIFLDENYGTSSRYALQFQVGILGIILTFALLWRKLGREKASVMRTVTAALCILFLAGNSYMTYHELNMAPHRKVRFEQRAQIALDFEQKTDDELRAEFEYRTSRPDSGAKVRSALTILKDNGWNVFRD